MEDKNLNTNVEASLPAVKPAGNVNASTPGARRAFAPRKDGDRPARQDGDRKRAFKKGGRKPRRGGSFRKESPYQEQVVAINRVAKTTKGGRKMSFNALVVVGDKKGKVGFSIAKAAEVPTAIKKAIQQAQKQIIKIPLIKGNTIPHQIIGRAGAGRVFLKDAPEGTGVIAGSATRAVLELAGVKNIYSKIQGSTTPINVVRATMNGLKNLKSREQVAVLRDKDVKDL